ncbi:M1 family metallopeptidase [Kitasatospora purpeofusca]|uniref:M1 family metallopeptidase n=1 Tax=Kitasatospora purpeofusca TaxID=67352 RepID=UPI0033D18C7D
MRRRHGPPAPNAVPAVLTVLTVLAVLLSLVAAAPPGRHLTGSQPTGSHLTGTHPPGDDPRTPAVVTHTLTLRSDATGAAWRGHQRVSFTQVAPEPLSAVHLRLWGNARGGCAAPAVRLTGISGTAAADCTAFKVPLPRALRQGESGSLDFELSVDVPEGLDRFGRDGAYTVLGNALPTLAVLDGDGWHLDPYTRNGESFYSLAADYSVTLDHPSGLLVPATGSAVDTPGEPGRTVTAVTARRVRDFAWAAGPFTRLSGRSGDGVRIGVFATPDITAEEASRMLELARTAIDAHSARFGAYPYGELAVVLDNAFWFSGMEYPGFVLDRVKPSALVHELAHQWWYGIVGDDQYRAPWLDESFSEYATDLVLGGADKDCANAPRWASDGERLTSPMSLWDAHPERYEAVVYDLGSCALHELGRLLGEETMAALLRDYARAHWYGVSTTAAFKAAARAVSPVDLDPFWREYRIDG